VSSQTYGRFDLRDFLAVHIFRGLPLLPVVALKLAATGWRFVRYYTRNLAYRRRGPPQILLRALAPLLVASTPVLFGTGVAFSPSDAAAGRC
jgi:hypothetical protein